MAGDSDKQNTRVMIVEDEPLFRDLLQRALSQYGGFDVVGAFGNGEDALAVAEELNPDVAILDIELRSSMNGVQVGLLLRRTMPDLGIVLLSNHGTPEFISSLPRDEIMGWSYLLKKSVDDIGSLARAIDGVMAGFVVVDPQIVKGMQPKPEGLLSRLTPRQLEILGLIAQGFANSAIAGQLVLSEKSVENQINIIYQQLEVRSSDEAAMQPRVKAVLTYLDESRGQAGPTPTA